MVNPERLLVNSHKARRSVTEFLNDIFGLGFFSDRLRCLHSLRSIRLRRLRQPARMIMIGIAGRTAADFFSIPGKTRGNISARAVLIAVGIAIVDGALISLSGSSETISEKSETK